MAAPWLGTAEAYEASFARLCAGTVADMINAFPAASGAWLLDVGTGPGTLAAAALRAGFVPVGVDADESMITLARRRHPSVAFVQAALPDLPSPDKTFDAVAANFVINHVPDPRAAVRELFRVTRRGGRLAATIWPAVIGPMNQLWNDVMEMAQVEPLRDVQLPPDRDFDRTADGFRNLLIEGGFDDVVTHEVQWLFEISPSDLWRAVSAGIATIGQSYQAQDETTQRRMRQAYSRLTRDRHPDGTLRLQSVAIAANGTRGLPTTTALLVNAHSEIAAG